MTNGVIGLYVARIYNEVKGRPNISSATLWGRDVLSKHVSFPSVHPAIRPILGFLSLFSFGRNTSHHDIVWTVLIAAFLGGLYGAFVLTYWSEAVEFGQAWAGLVDCSKSAWCAVMLADQSLQITVPALLLRAGVSTWTLSLASSAFCCALAFASVAAAAFVFTRHIALSVAMSILLLTYVFSNPYGYPVVYPISQSQFGQTGQYLCLLALAFAACGRMRTAALLGGLLSGMHAVWCLCFIISLPAIYFFQRHAFKRFLCWFVMALAVTLAFQHIGVASLPAHPKYVPPTISKEVLRTQAPLESTSPTKIRSTFELHNILFSDAPYPTITTIAFFLPTAVWLLFSVSYVLTARATAPLGPQLPDARLLLCMAALPTFVAILFKIMEECDPHFSWLGFIDPRRELILAIALFGLLFTQLHIAVGRALIERRYTGSDSADAFVATVAADRGQLILSTGVDGAYGFLTQLRTGRPVVLPYMLDVNDQTSRIFCYTDAHMSLEALWERVQPCFEKRTLREWKLIARALPATGIITPDNWKLALPRAATGGGFNYYLIPLADR